MRWAHHKLTSGSLVYAATGNATAAGLTMAGSVLPDMVEFPLQGLLRHRGLSHWLPLFLLPSAALAATSLYTGHFALAYLACIPFGGVLHLLADGLSPGGIVWGWPSSPRRGLNLYRTFTSSEALVAAGWAGICCAVAAARGFLDGPYLAGEAERALLLLAWTARALGVPL